jgi:hypothetical protein
MDHVRFGPTSTPLELATSRAFREIACYLLACARDYSFSIRRDLTLFSSVFCFGVVGASDEYSLSSGLGW